MAVKVKAICKVTTKDLYWKELKNNVASMRNAKTEVGLPARGKFRRNKDSRVKTYSQLIMIALYNEYGSTKTNLPERALLRKTLEQNKVKVGAMTKKYVREILRGKLTSKEAMFQVGEFLAQKVRDNIIKGMPPKNAPSTIERKGFNHPLLETGLLYDNIQHVETFDVRK